MKIRSPHTPYIPINDTFIAPKSVLACKEIIEDQLEQVISHQTNYIVKIELHKQEPYTFDVHIRLKGTGFEARLRGQIFEAKKGTGIAYKCYSKGVLAYLSMILVFLIVFFLPLALIDFHTYLPAVIMCIFILLGLMMALHDQLQPVLDVFRTCLEQI